jgi:hypothetical protein
VVPRLDEHIPSLGDGKDAEAKDEREEKQEARREPHWKTHR